MNDGCEVAAECNAVRAPAATVVDVVYGVPGEQGGRLRGPGGR